MLIAAYRVCSMPGMPHPFYDAMLPWPSTLALLALSASIYYLCQAGMSRAMALSRRRLHDNHALEEMHDTLIQGVQGLMLSLQATASQLPGEGQGRAQIEGLLDEAENLLAQGRQAMQDEQRIAQPGSGLEQALAELAFSLAASSQVSFCLSISGHALPITVAARNAIYQLARTAMINAAFHAHAQRVEVELCHALDSLGLHIRDDGRAYARVGPATANKHGYPGVQQMLAQVSTLQSRLEIWSAPGAGTEWSLSLSSPVASGQQFAKSRLSSTCRFLQKLLYRH